eukprot:SAG31_NODE_3386_length_4331_cov_2.421786_3_plen_162_part_00
MSDATGVAGEFLLPILKQIPFDAITVGNHELYEDSTVENLVKSGFIEHWGERYLSSNQRYADGSPIGSLYTVLNGVHGAKMLAFGFLYNFDGSGHSTIVARVEEVVKEPWFTEALLSNANVDAIAVLAHMDYRDEAVEVLRIAVRAVVRFLQSLFGRLQFS